MSEMYDAVLILRVKGATKEEMKLEANERGVSLSEIGRERLESEKNTKRQEK